jgi:hypothetical protein
MVQFFIFEKSNNMTIQELLQLIKNISRFRRTPNLLPVFVKTLALDKICFGVAVSIDDA